MWGWTYKLFFKQGDWLMNMFTGQLYLITDQRQLSKQLNLIIWHKVTLYVKRPTDWYYGGGAGWGLGVGGGWGLGFFLEIRYLFSYSCKNSHLLIKAMSLNIIFRKPPSKKMLSLWLTISIFLNNLKQNVSGTIYVFDIMILMSFSQNLWMHSNSSCRMADIWVRPSVETSRTLRRRHNRQEWVTITTTTAVVQPNCDKSISKLYIKVKSCHQGTVKQPVPYHNI